MAYSRAHTRSFLPHILIVVLILAFTGLIFGGWIIYQDKPPTPAQVVSDSGEVLFTGRDIEGGQATFLRFGIMDHGTIYGHGGYLAPDFTADYLHNMGVELEGIFAQESYQMDYAQLSPEQKAFVNEKVKNELKTNRYDPASGKLTLTAAQTKAYKNLSDYYANIFTQGKPEWRIEPGLVPDTPDPSGSTWHSPKSLVRQLSDYIAWTAWTASANRPGLDYSYTNNWPPDKLVGNEATRDTMLWSAASLGILLFSLGLILYIYVKYRFTAEESELAALPTVETFSLVPSQLKVAKYFLVVTALLVVQSLLGSLTTHYYVESNFFGIPLNKIIPFSLSRTWHLQIAIFWIATSWVAGGIFIAPLVSGKEPKFQGLLVDILFVAILVVAVGSLLGEFLSSHNIITDNWFLLGDQGWEYVELGRVWQILLVVGLAIWLFIVYRSLRYRLKVEDSKASLSHLLLYASISIPLFYAAGFMFNPNTTFAVADFWRWFIIHLWVESFFEFFATVATAYLLVSLGLVTKKSATRAVYFTVILVFFAGLEGIGHHYWWIGTPAAWISIGAVFSALEVIPLTLLIFDAVAHLDIRRRLGKGFHYRSAISFLISAAVWNFLGAGVLGFLINPPIVSYYEHGTYLTPTHGHGSMMGTYGMLGLAILVFCLRTIVKPEAWNEKRVHLSMILLNAGLVLMLVLNLLPVGFLQLAAAFDKGTWFARSAEFYTSPTVMSLVWARIVGDLVFIAGAAL
ncbi:MAG TPA: nitric-oxide reductase large subunit, partial [Verrucomicrobiae bacterium]|nr:nitric-oxide reductase large subunit [Verrucomicrobiae bacterium]